ncbi:unnamed protein product [Pylaiella littoralis]
MRKSNRWLGLLGAAVILSSAGVLATTSDVFENCDAAESMGNGFCEQWANNEECGYDGGDCCSCTCDPENGNEYTCQDFACIDPEAPCVNDDDLTAGMLDICGDLLNNGNSWCDYENNSAECGYDGGDCCECTCVTTDGNGCVDFACIDPEASCVDDDDITVDLVQNCERAISIGDGYCDIDLNTAECAYDGGDCCECTCENSPDNTCGQYGFYCIDPGAACVNDDDITVDMVENCGYVGAIGDGHCHETNNNAECNYDGGDCCECTCIARADDEYGCEGFACIDPDAACVDDDLVTVDMIGICDAENIGNGFCDSENNSPECVYDGGDCCECTCDAPSPSDPGSDGYVCGPLSYFDCQDPSAPCFGGGTISQTDDSDDVDDTMSYDFALWEDEEPLPTLDGAVDVGTNTVVAVSATAYDVRPGASGGQQGCGEVGGDGCAPANTRDGIVSDTESRWSCAAELVDGGGPCHIEYTFGQPQDIVDIQVAFYKGDERTRTLDVRLDGELTHTFESYTGSTFNTLGVEATGVSTVMLESVYLLPEEWISLLEVRAVV